MPARHSTTNGDLLGTLPSLPPFQCLSPKARARLCANARLQTFAAGELLYSEGQTGVLPAFLLSGLVKLTQNAISGKECLAHMVRPGRFLDVGVLVYTTGLPFSARGIRAATSDNILKFFIIFSFASFCHPFLHLIVQRRQDEKSDDC